MNIPLAVVSSMFGATEAQVARMQVSAGATMQARAPHTLIHIFTATSSELPPHTTTTRETEDEWRVTESN